MRKLTSHNFLTATALLCLVWILLPIALHSQTVALKLRNGDRLTGKIIFENTNHVALSNAWTKEIIVPLAEIQARETVAPTSAITNSPATNEIPLVKTAPVIPPAKPAEKARPPSAWHGDVQVGADVGISDTRRELYYGKFKISYTPMLTDPTPGKSSFIGRFRNIFDYNAAYGTTDGILSANRMDGSSKTDFDLGKARRFFAYNLVGSGYDEIRRIDLRYEVGPGIGYHVLARSNFVFNTEVGMNYQVQYLQNRTRTERFYYRLAEDATWKVTKTLTFDEKFEFFPQVNMEDFRMRFESNLRYWILENLSFNLTLLRSIW